MDGSKVFGMTRFHLGTRVVFYASLAACTFSSQPQPIEIIVPVLSDKPPTTPAEQLAALEAIAPADSPDAEQLADIRAVLRAQDIESRGKRELAAEAWMEALKIARGVIGQRALHGWIRAYTAGLGKQTDRQILARLLLVETHYGRLSPYMKDNGLISETALVAELEKAVPEALLPPTSGQTEAETEAPAAPGIPGNDLLLIKAAARYCVLSSELQLRWESWLNSLGRAARSYWGALIEDCRRNYAGAGDAYQNALPVLMQSRATHNLALSAAARQINVQRAMGKRESVAQTYEKLLEVWRLDGLNAKAFGMSTDEFALKQIDDTLWASRSIALTGNLERAKALAQHAQDLISRMYVNSPNMSQRSRDALGNLRAEAFQILAFRVALERGEHDRALAINAVAMQSPDISVEWKERFLWLSGVYDFLAGNYPGAKRRWEQLLNNLRDESLRPQIYYWTARALRQMQQVAESDFYIKSLVQDYPTNFYAVVGLSIADLPDPDRWRSVFADSGKHLTTALKNRKDFDIENIRAHPRVGPALRRAELLVQARLCDWGRIALQELETPSRRDFRLPSYPGLYVYVSRLHYACGNYVQAVSITTDLSNTISGFWQTWPEQLLVHFPQAYADIARRQAASAGIQPAEVLAVARQESTFRPMVASPAGALGLMQIMIPTAERLANQLKLESSDMATRLLDPELNATLGAAYLQQLRDYYKGNIPAVYGGYNAGEYAVDGWLVRRQTTDPAMWVELVPFQETKSYIRNVWRNVFVYNFIAQYDSK